MKEKMNANVQKNGCQFVVIIFLTLLLAVILTGCSTKDHQNLQEISLDEKAIEEKSEEKESVTTDSKEVEKNAVPRIFVYVCGQVGCPSVYELPEDSRVYDAIQAAGGMSEQAAKDYLNQAEKLKDGMRIYVPSVEEAESNAKDGVQGLTNDAANDTVPVSDSSKVNLNTASKEQLMTLSGIGEAKADAIVRYREEQSGFSVIEDIMNIEGIKEGVFSKIKDDITV